MAQVKAQSRPRTLQAAAQAEVVRDQERPGSSPGGATETRWVTSVVARRFCVMSYSQTAGLWDLLRPQPAAALTARPCPAVAAQPRCASTPEATPPRRRGPERKARPP